MPAAGQRDPPPPALSPDSTSCKRKIPRLPGPCSCAAGATTTANMITAMKAPPVQAVHSDRDTDNASSILPAELWLDIMCLCQPSPRLPATCRTTSSQPGSPAHRIWSHRHIFLNPEHDPNVTHSANTAASRHAEINSWYPSVSQCESHLAYYLKAHAPTSDDLGYEFASGLAPEPGQHVPTTVFSVAMVEWLFGAAGPFGRQSHQTNELNVLAALAQVRPDLGSEAESDSDSDGGEDENGVVAADASSSTVSSPATPAKQLPRTPPLPTWRLVPDPFLLAHFFIRTSQLDLLELTLTRMRTLFPTLLTSTAPFSLWARLMLDNRTQLRSLISAIVDSDGDPHMSYPTFSCFLALIDWSKSALDVITRVFADSFDATIAATLITSTRHMMDSILSTLHGLTSPPSDSSRVLLILDWFQTNNAHINLQEFPFLSHCITGSYSIFADVFLLCDLANLPFLFDNPDRHVLGSTIAQWIVVGHPDLLHVALEYDLLDEEDKGTLMRHAAEKGDVDGLLAAVAVTCTGDEDVLKNVVLDALKTHTNNDEPDPPSMYSTLLNTLVDFGPTPLDPTSILMRHSQTWSPRALSIMLFDPAVVGALHFSWDYARYLDQQLTWAASAWAFSPGAVTFLGVLIDKCIQDGAMRWGQLDAEKTATACALRLVAALHKYKFVTGLCTMDAVEIVDDEDVGAIEFLASLAAAKIGATNASTESDGGNKTFGVAIPPGARDLLRPAIQSASTFSPTDACTCDPSTAHSATCSLSDSRAIHNLIFDTLYTLDRAYVLAHVAWHDLRSARVWHRFEPAEVTSRINLHHALGLLRAALRDSAADQVAGGVAGVVNGLPRIVLEGHVFLCGLRGLTRMKGMGDGRNEAMMRGLDASRWGGEWREQIARVTPLPEEEDAEDEQEFSLFG